MPRHPIAFSLPTPLPSLPNTPRPDPSPLQQTITNTLSSTDYDLVSLPLTNGAWQDRWERLCLRPVEDEEDLTPEQLELKDREREKVDLEADVWRRDGGLKREEVNVSRLEESQAVITTAAEWLELDSPDEGIRFDSEIALRSEMAQALYLSLPVLIIPAPQLINRAFLPSYARAISNLLQMGGSSAFTQISIRIPISDPVELITQGPAPSSQSFPPNARNSITNINNTAGAAGAGAGAGAGNKHKRMSSLSTRPTSMHQAQLNQMINQSQSQTQTSNFNYQNLRIASGASSTMSTKSSAAAINGDPSSTWEMWDCIRTLCGYHPRLSITLDLTNPLPPSVGALARWTAEPVKYIWLPAVSFIPNAKGYPVLSKACQAFLRGMGKQNPTYVLHGTTVQKHTAGGPNAYLQYVRHITSAPSAPNGLPPSADEFTSGYADYLQAPLQPLMDDLGSATYDIFERDPVKYRQYEEAITLALGDLPVVQKHVVTVVGAGRGPLVACTLRALSRSNRQANVYAVEKNPNAFITLQERKAIEWGDQVEIFFGDMRNVEVPEKCDIMVSELLGSFGDNELSPECLDGAMRFLKPTGISIPTSYTAHVAPISSSKLFHDVHQPTRPAGATETPYVVMMSQVNLISGDGGGVSGRCGEKVQQCWQFEHPRRDLILDASGAPLTNTHNTRSSRHVFHIPHAATLHGLAGYFEAHLYGNVGLSIHPDNAHRVSPDMFSWFPLYFPLKESLYLPSGSELEVNLWRLCDSRGRKIWYEWSIESYLSVTQNIPNSASLINSSNLTPNGSRHASTSGVPGGGGQPSPLMDAPFSPGFNLSNNNNNNQSSNFIEVSRVKIGQTSLHNPAGIHSWVGL